MNKETEIAAAYLLGSKAMIELLLNGQPNEVLEAVTGAIDGGASIVLELTYPPEGLQGVALLLAHPSGARQAVARVQFAAGLRH